MSPESFWVGYQPGFRVASVPIGSPRFFSEVEEHRYATEPAILEMARFEAWAGRDVLEAGCGIATDGVNFARRGARYTGVDLSDSAVMLARQRFGAEGLAGEILQASILDIPVADESQDLVYSNGVIHHVPDTQRAVDEMWRVLRPGGRVVVMVYHRASLNYWLTIMFVRRLLAAGLLVPGFTDVAARATGEPLRVLAGHRRLLAEHGARYLTDPALFLSNNTDGPGNPLSKVYSRDDALRLFRRFATVKTEARFLNLRLYPYGRRLERSAAGRWLERRVGWHLWIDAHKPG